MKQYNIYAGIKEPFDDTSYQFTGLYNSKGEAIKDAYNNACAIYEEYVGYYGLRGYSEVSDQYCSKNNIVDLTDEDIKIIDKIYFDEVDNWIEYYAIETADDNLDKESLILGYVIENGDLGEISGK